MEYEYTDVDKAADGLAFVLTDELRNIDEFLYEPLDLLGKAIEGSEHLNPVIDEFGFPRFVAIEQVQEIASVMKTITFKDVQAQFDPQAMQAADVSPGDWSVIGFDYIWEKFTSLRRFYSNAAKHNKSVIVWRS